ncbi:MAG: hypothetical protein JWM15_2697, partial [Cryptosporangiaceae bacterium]|nr:hypothetical protein [Cryptosporangiaceae bacterium]
YPDGHTAHGAADGRSAESHARS